MSTIITCPRCGGALNPPPGHQHPCTCSKPVEPGATEEVVGEKVCIACGKDVSTSKRMKDSKGNYWCYECGKASRTSMKQSSAAPPKVKCPICKKQVPSVTLLMDGGTLVCPKCYKAKRTPKTTVELETTGAGSGKLLWITLAVVAGGAIAAYLMFFK